MDELTIGNKTYISSKQAAKITGYAKDYVGQLCREGRVDARLVGRSWYVLEDSIREHRFGKDEQPAAPVEKPKVDTLSTWSKPSYTSESPSLVPELRPEAPAKESKAIVDMQSAWREWFDSGRKALPDGAEDFSGEYLPVVSNEDLAEEDTDPEESDDAVPISRISVEKEEILEQETGFSKEEPIAVHRSYTAIEEVTSKKQATERHAEPKSVSHPSRRGSGGLMLRALCLAVAMLAVVISLIGTGAAERFVGPGVLGNVVENSVYKYLAGASTVENTR